MSWPQWPVGTGTPAWPQSAIISPAGQPVASTATPMAPGTPYTPEQWANMQQQNWQQWMQWHQQYQQWQQQYGEQVRLYIINRFFYQIANLKYFFVSIKSQYLLLPINQQYRQ